MQRKGIVPRNHLKDNRAAISELSAKIHAMKQILSKSDEPTIPVPTSKSQGNLQTTERVDCINYLAKNFKEAAMPARRRTPKTETEPHKQKENFGKIPAYLIKRKIELAQEAEKRLQEEEAKSLPPGLVLMCDEEREKLMKTLEENKADIVRKLSALPLVVEIPSQVRAKSEMDFQLRETEEAIKRFSRPKVYISLNE
ncbi:hypothetical protein O6H91_06G085800 [Diphasiastrum complanatum]|uniref:Uncharacterized protein n=1 Tax=Diphasiastrum complanatum TaxID=34168 RepID=A0ACC2DG34_DIPCM|nr:hypothetical protein O6H91_06G085800 [Diphasiastrum complanatum]